VRKKWNTFVEQELKIIIFFKRTSKTAQKTKVVTHIQIDIPERSVSRRLFILCKSKWPPSYMTYENDTLGDYKAS